MCTENIHTKRQNFNNQRTTNTFSRQIFFFIPDLLIVFNDQKDESSSAGLDLVCTKASSITLTEIVSLQSKEREEGRTTAATGSER